jgi:hypothetical protein
MKVWIVELLHAIPPLTMTTDAEQRDAWIEQGVATAVYEIDALQVYPDQAAPSTPARSAPSGTLV